MTEPNTVDEVQVLSMHLVQGSSNYFICMNRNKEFSSSFILISFAILESKQFVAFLGFENYLTERN